jgi:hypothetical protein
MLDPHFVWLSAFFNMVGSSRYAYQTVVGRTQPNRVTWFLWGVIPLVAFFAELGQNVGLQSLMTLAVGVGPLIVFTASMVNRQAYWKFTSFDIACGTLSILAVILWRLSGSGDVAIALSILADTLAGLPTAIKAWRHPETESSSAFLFGTCSAAITLLTIRNWTFATYGFPFYILVVSLYLFLTIRFKLGKKRSGSASAES